MLFFVQNAHDLGNDTALQNNSVGKKLVNKVSSHLSLLLLELFLLLTSFRFYKIETADRVH